MNVQQLHYTIDTFELNYEATPLTLGAPTTSSNSYFPRRLANKGHKNLLSGNRFGGLTGGAIMGNLTSNDVVFDTICFELPAFFTQSTNTDKCIEIQYIHLMQRPHGIETSTTSSSDGKTTTIVKNITPSISPTGKPILTTTTITTNSDGTTETITEVSNNEEWIALASTMHSDLIQFRPSADSYVMSTNVMYNWEKKFYLPTNKSSFDIWFRDMFGRVIELDPSKTRIIIELLLTF